MSKENCFIYIDDESFSFEVEGEFYWGAKEVLFKKDGNIISKAPWFQEGFSVVDAFEASEFLAFKKSVTASILMAIQENGIPVNADTFELEQYHTIVTTDEDHYKVINITRNLTNEDLDFDIENLVSRFGSILGFPLTSWIEELKKTHIQIRINRPSSLDINPPHRDGYLDFWKDILNIWIPIAGCNEMTSLPVLPGSHLISEDHILRTKAKGAKINGNTYNVPCILKTRGGAMKMIRPNPKEGQAIIFSPFLVHGAAVNRSEVTRVSIELRFAKN